MIKVGSYVRLRFRNGVTIVGKVRSQREDGAWNIQYSYPSADFGSWLSDIPVYEKHLEETTEKEYFLYQLKNGL